MFTVKIKQDPSVTNVTALQLINTVYHSFSQFNAFLKSSLISTPKIKLNDILLISRLSADNSAPVYNCFLTINNKGENTTR